MTERGKEIATTGGNDLISPFSSINGFESAQRMAKAIAASSFCPKEFRGNIGDCLIVIETAARTGMPLMALLQNTYVVHGKPSFSSSFMAGLINGSGRFDGPLRFVYNDDRTSCYAVATKNGEEYRGITITMEMAQREGWLSKKGSKWQTMPELMLQYRAISFFARAYCADLIMGMRSADEVADADGGIIEAEIVDGNGQDINERFGAEPVDTSTGEIMAGGNGEQKKPRPKAKKSTKKHESNPAQQDSPAAAKLRNEIDAIDNCIHLDRWRMKHIKRIERELKGDEGAIAAIMEYADKRYKALKDEDHPADAPGGGKMIDCPAGHGNVPEEYCNSECKSRAGCPAWE